MWTSAVALQQAAVCIYFKYLHLLRQLSIHDRIASVAPPDIRVVINGVWPAVSGGVAEISAALSLEAWYCRPSCIENSRYWLGCGLFLYVCWFLNQPGSHWLDLVKCQNNRLEHWRGGSRVGIIDWFNVCDWNFYFHVNCNAPFPFQVCNCSTSRRLVK